jgi:VanZ family protein
MNAATRFALYRLPAIVYMAVIFYLSSGPIDLPLIRRIPDYTLHGTAYAGLYVLLFRAVHSGLRVQPGRGGLALPLALTVLYGLSDEFHQSFVPSRDASVADLIADAVGGVVALVAVAALPHLISIYRRGIAS